MKVNFRSIFFPHDHKKDHFRALDGLRGMAVLFVMLSHSSNEHVYFASFLKFSQLGHIGVYLFFVLSAYLLDRQIALALMSNNSSWLYWRNYFIRRFLRIFPLFAFALIVHYILSLTIMKTVIATPSDIIDHLLLVKGEAFFWSIPVEFKYYFISPLIMLICHKVFKWKPKATFLFLGAIIFTAIGSQAVFHLSEINTFRYFPIFLVGTMLSIFELILMQKINLIKYSKLLEVLAFLSIGVILVTIPYYFSLLTHRRFPNTFWGFYLPYSVLWGIVLLAAKYGLGYIRNFFEFKFLRYIGAISFSVYLFHYPVLNLIKNNPHIPQYLKAPVFFLGAIAVSTITYLLIENPVSRIKLKRKSLSEDMLVDKQAVHSTEQPVIE